MFAGTATKTFRRLFGFNDDHPASLNAMVLRRSYATNTYRMWLAGDIWPEERDDRVKLKIARQMNTSISQLEMTYISTDLPEEDGFDATNREERSDDSDEEPESQNSSEH